MTRHIGRKKRREEKVFLDCCLYPQCMYAQLHVCTVQYRVRSVSTYTKIKTTPWKLNIHIGLRTHLIPIAVVVASSRLSSHFCLFCYCCCCCWLLCVSLSSSFRLSAFPLTLTSWVSELWFHLLTFFVFHLFCFVFFFFKLSFRTFISYIHFRRTLDMS